MPAGDRGEERYAYCVWYRVLADDPDSEVLVRAMMARLACRAGVVGELMKKRDEPCLWMEYYPEVVDPGAFESRLAQAVDEYDVEMLVADRRRSECFRVTHRATAACAVAPAERRDP